MEFTPLTIKGIYNLGFGDLQSDGNIDDKPNSNNGDIIKVLATVIYIIKDFEGKPGSAKERTKLYQRIIKTYFNDFRKEFHITALEGPANNPKETVFDAACKEPYLAFL